MLKWETLIISRVRETVAGADSSRVRIVQRDIDQSRMGVEYSASSSLALKRVCDGCTESRVGWELRAVG